MSLLIARTLAPAPAVRIEPPALSRSPRGYPLIRQLRAGDRRSSWVGLVSGCGRRCWASSRRSGRRRGGSRVCRAASASCP